LGFCIEGDDMDIHQKITYLIDNDFSEDEDGILWNDVAVTIIPFTVNDEDTTLILHSILNESLQEDKRVSFVWLLKEIKNDVDKVKFLIDVAKKNADSYFADCILEVVSFLPHTKENSDTVIELLQDKDLNQNFKESVLSIFTYSDNIEWIDTTKLMEILKDEKQSDVIKESIQKIIEKATTPSYTQQIARIKTKFAKAKEIDSRCEVFGASKHQYQLGRTVTQKEVSEFEERYNVELPECYRAFITEFAGISAVEPIKDKDEYIPAPNYGLFSFDRIFNEVEGVYDYERLLHKPTVIVPYMDFNEWCHLIDDLDEENENEYLRGLLPLGYQDCEERYYVFLVLFGVNKGKVVYLGFDDRPFFTHEDNFLDWYERWLDEIIDGTLQNSWIDFARYMRGNEEVLVKKFVGEPDYKVQLSILDSIHNLDTLCNKSLDILVKYFNSDNIDIYLKIIEILAKHSDDLEVDELKKILNGDDEMCSSACFIISHYKNDKLYWRDILLKRLKNVKDTETLQSITDILDDIDYNYYDEISPLLEEADSYKKEVIYDRINKFPNKPFALTLKIKWHRFIRFIKEIFIVATMLIIGVLYFSVWILFIMPFEYISLIFKKLGRSKDE